MGEGGRHRAPRIFSRSTAMGFISGRSSAAAVSTHGEEQSDVAMMPLTFAIQSCSEIKKHVCVV